MNTGFLLPLIILIVCSIFYTPIQEGFNGAVSYFIDLIWRQSVTSWGRLHSYNNTCLTGRPYGSPGTQGPNDNWANRERYMQQEYAGCSKYRCGDLTNLRDNEPEAVRKLRSIRDVSNIPLDYYHNPSDFCQANPGRFPCPNHWLGQTLTPADSRLDHKILPTLKQGLEKHIKDTQIDDNYHSRVLYPESEDHGLC